MISTAKAIATSRDLAEKLAKRLAGGSGLNTVRQAFDTAGWPMIVVSHNGTETESNAVVLIRIKGVDMVSKDVFGNATTAYTPHTMELAYEMTATANKPIPLTTELAVCQFEAIKCGVRMQIKEIANGTAANQAAIDAASASVDLDDLYWPTKLA